MNPICPVCWHTLESWKCPKCKAAFPVVRGEVPVLVKDAGSFLSGLCQQYEAYVEQCQRYVDSLALAMRQEPDRESILGACRTGFLHNAAIVSSLLDDLKPYAVEAAADHVGRRTGAGAAYSPNFNYLRRDWGLGEAGERELSAIHSALRVVLGEAGKGVQEALVLGAGPGRTAWDLCEWIPRVTAVDLSYAMPAFYRRVIKGDLAFYEINRSNMLRREDLVRRVEARAPGVVDARQRTKRLSYWVADATALPVADRSVDAVFSIYFTDVLPFEGLIGEVKRVLKPGGWFVHFGPLDYHFQNYAASLSAEELRERIGRHGFAVRSESTVQTVHLETAGQMSRHTCDNWVFAAENVNTIRRGPIQNADILYLPVPVRYQQTGNIAGGRESGVQVSLLLPGGKSFECGLGVPSLLRLVDGVRSAGEVAALMKAQHRLEQPTAERDILQMLDGLVENGIVAVR